MVDLSLNTAIQSAGTRAYPLAEALPGYPRDASFPAREATLAVHLESFPGNSQLTINIIGGLRLIAAVLEILRNAPENASLKKAR